MPQHSGVSTGWLCCKQRLHVYDVALCTCMLWVMHVT